MSAPFVVTFRRSVGLAPPDIVGGIDAAVAIKVSECSWLRNACDTKTNGVRSTAGPLLLRCDDDMKRMELLLQGPPRTPRADELESFTRSKSVSSHSYTLPPWPTVP